MFEVPFKLRIWEMEISLEREAHLFSLNKLRWGIELIIIICINLFAPPTPPTPVCGVQIIYTHYITGNSPTKERCHAWVLHLHSPRCAFEPMAWLLWLSNLHVCLYCTHYNRSCLSPLPSSPSMVQNSTSRQTVFQVSIIAASLCYACK